jgi:hypothetical protein
VVVWTALLVGSEAKGKNQKVCLPDLGSFGRGVGVDGSPPSDSHQYTALRLIIFFRMVIGGTGLLSLCLVYLYGIRGLLAKIIM